LTDSLSQERIQDWIRQEKQALETQRGWLSRSMKSNKKKVLESLHWVSMIWMLKPLMQCPSRLEIRLKLNENAE